MGGIEAAFFGSLGRDAERKVSKASKDYVRLNVRVGDGADAQWVNVTSFDHQAIAAVDKLTKGALAHGILSRQRRAPAPCLPRR